MLGRSPETKPLTSLETAVFMRCLQWHWDGEVEPRATARAMGIPDVDGV